MSRLVGSVAIRSCLKLVADLRGLRQHVGGSRPTTVTFSLTAADAERHVDRQRLRRRQVDRLAARLEAAQLEGHRVGARWQPGEDVVAVGRRDGRADALKVRTKPP